jgi:hypothetical protein
MQRSGSIFATGGSYAKVPNISNPPHPRTVTGQQHQAVSEAAQSEFASSKSAEPTSMQRVQPARPITTVRAE